MWLSGVSLCLALLPGGTTPQVGRLTPQDDIVWQGMAPSIATLLEGSRAIGPAALIDDSGLFVASRLVGRSNAFEARLADGRLTRMHVIARDGAAGLLLLQAENWMSGLARPFHAPNEVEQPGGRLLAVLGTGPIRAEFVDSNKYGVLAHSHRLVPICEFRFEAPAEALGGALIFCENGEIIGPLNATLRRQDTGLNNNVFGQGALSDRNASAPRFPTLPNPNFLQQAQAIGPSELTVAYTAGPSVVRRVINGFRSSSHVITFPSLGVMCLNNIGGGAVIQSVVRQSAADKAGLRPGDIIHDIGGSMIRNQVDFAQVMSVQEVGAHVVIRISRRGSILVRDVTIGRAPSDDND